MEAIHLSPFENRADADAAFSIVSQLGDILEQLQLIELASRQFADAPDGLLGWLALGYALNDRWQDYQHTLDLHDDPEFTGLSDRILELVRRDRTLSAEDRKEIATLIREYYKREE